MNYCTANEVEMVEENGKHFVKVNSVPLVRSYLGKLLGEVQRIKSEGDYKFAHMLISTYGANVDPKMHKESIARYESLGLPSFIGFETPVVEKDNNNQINLHYVDNFIERSLLNFHKGNQSLAKTLDQSQKSSIKKINR